MERRTFLSLPLAGTVLASGSVGAFSAEFENFSRAAYDQALASGEALLLDFYAGW